MAAVVDVDTYVARLADPQRAVAAALRALVRSAAPEATEAIKWAQPVFSDHGPFAYIRAHAHHVTFGFWRGVEVDAGRGLLETGGAKMAHVKLRSPEEIDEPLLRGMVETAVRLNREKGDPSRVRG